MGCLASGGCGPRLQDELAGVVTRHVEVDQHRSGPGGDYGGRHNFLVNSQNEQDDCKGQVALHLHVTGKSSVLQDNNNLRTSYTYILLVSMNTGR